MPVDDDQFFRAAVRGDVAGVAIKVSIALGEIASALDGLSKGKDISENVKALRKSAEELDRTFDRLTGWKQ